MIWRRMRLGARAEAGISSLMVGVSVTALFGSASIAVDVGNLWATRRHVIVASDAAALAAAQDYAVGRDGCSAAAGKYVKSNDDKGQLTACSPFGVSRLGYVAVEAETPVDFAFAGVLGVSDRTVKARTAASWGIPSAVRGLRPFGLCKDDPNFVRWVQNPRGTSGVARIPYTNSPTDCGGAPGNWAIIDLDNRAPVSESDIDLWIRRGYQGRVRPGNINGSPGAFSNNIDDAMASIIGTKFPIPVFDRVSGGNQSGGAGGSQGNGGGINANFHVIGFVEVQLVSWRTTGSETMRYLDVRFVESVTTGDCCEPEAIDFGLRAVHICEVEPDFNPENCLPTETSS